MRYSTSSPSVRPFIKLIALVLTVSGASSGFNPPAYAGLAALARQGLAIGGVVHGYDDQNWNRGDYLSVAAREFNAITATAYMTWIDWKGPAQPPDTSGLTSVIDWARARDMRVHGHVLVYPAVNAELDWYQQPDVDHEAVLKRYITAMASARAGKVWVWDVVNEVMADPGESGSDEFGLRTDYVEYRKIGADYVDKAFHWAHSADPDALLIINDYGAETVNEKSDNLLRYVQELRRRGVPVDGVGFQMHIFATRSDEVPDYDSMRRNFQRFADAGFRLFVTEMDVSIVRAATATDQPSKTDLLRQRRIYENITRIAAEQPAVKALLLWDFADECSWLNPVSQDLGDDLPIGTYMFPAPFSGGAVGEKIRPKPAYFGIEKILRETRW